MLRPDVTTPLVGASGAKGLTRNDSNNFTAHGPAGCQCRINPSGCLFCRRWDKRIRGIDARRADSLRRQSMGYLMRAGG
jgi:hypothetical protein